MKRFLFLLSLMLAVSHVQADDFKVLFVNDTQLSFVNGKSVKVGDVFSDVKEIVWTKEKQAVKAINLKTKKQTLFVGKNWVKKAGFDALLHNRHLSTHEGQDDHAELTVYDKLLRMFADQYDLLDSIEVKSEVELSETCFFQATYEYGDKKVTKRLKHRDDVVIIDKTLFNVDEGCLEPRDIILSIDYNDDSTSTTIFVKDNIELIVYPTCLSAESSSP